MTDTAVMYDDTVGDLVDEIETKVSQARSLRGAEREHNLKTAADLVKEARKKLYNLKVEVRNLPNADKPQFEKKAANHTERLNELNTLITKLKKEDLSEGTSVTFGAGAGAEDDGRGEVKRLQGQISHNQGKSLASVGRMEQTLAKTEQTAQETSAELSRQGAVIAEIDAKLDELGTDVERAKKELNAFVRRMATDKLILCFLFLLVIGIVAAIVVHFVTGDSDDGNETPVPTPVS
ncbi:putative plant SNARE 12 [Diplonema papillatum]|nr:putative plant SNARE 12 [Diplonema papillatum]